MIQPKIRFNGFSDEWVEKKLGEVFKKESIKNSHLEYGSSKIISLANLYYKNDLDNVPSDSYMKTYNEFKVGDIAFEGNKNKNYRYGRFIANTLGDGVISHVFEVYKPKVVFDIHYLGEFINYEPIMGRILRRTTKSTTMMTSLVSSDFLKESVQLPTLPEQQKIGALFSKYDAIIALREQKLAELNALKKGMLQQMFDDGSTTSHKPQVRFSGFNDVWVKKKLGEVVDVKYGHDYKDASQIGNIPVYGTGGILAMIDKYQSDSSDAVGLGRKGTINKPFVLKAPFWTVDTLFQIYPKASLDLFFQLYLFNNINWLKYNESTGVPSLSKLNIKNVVRDLPSLSEQQKIGQLFKHLDARISNEQSKIEQLKAQKQGLLQKMLS